MAYEIYIASVSDDLIKKLSRVEHPDDNSSIRKEEVRIASISHYFVSNTTELGLDFDRTLIAAIEGGADLNFWHPLRPPRFYLSNEVVSINRNLKGEWSNVLKKFSVEYLEYHIMDFQPVFDIYDFSENSNLGIVSFLNKPHDDRAAKVIYPIQIG